MTSPSIACFAGAAVAAATALTPATAGVAFAPPVIVDTPGATADILLVDLDGDGDLDIASLEVDFNFPEATGMVNVALNDGAGNFGPSTSFGLGTVAALEFAFQRLVAADHDGDLDLDLAVIGTTAPLTLLTNDGAGGFGTAVATEVTVVLNFLASALTAGDLDGDGDLDFAVGPTGQLATNDGSGVFTASPFSADTSAKNLTAADLDGDGDLDLAYGTKVHLNDGFGNFTPLEGFYPGSGAFNCVFEDFDGDDDLDVACARGFPFCVSIAANDGGGTFAAPVVFETASGAQDIHAGRFDGDGNLDLLVAHGNGSAVIGVYVGHGDGTFDDAILLPSPNGTVAAAGDVNGDGLDDVVMSTASQLTSGPLAVLLNDGVPVTPGDLDGDGDVDTVDFLALLAAWGPCPLAGGCPGDLDGDGNVGVVDFLTLLANWGAQG